MFKRNVEQGIAKAYRCEFKFKGQKLSVVSDLGMKVFREGFWLNDDYKLIEYPYSTEAPSFVCKYWIPPSQILFVAIDRVKVK